MKERTKPITPTEAKRNLHALDILSGRVTAPANRAKTGKRIQHEAQIQTMLFQWAKLHEYLYPELRLLYHCPNGGSRDAVECYHLKQQGVRAGVPDLILPVARGQYYGLYLEVKAEGGRLQDSQKQWLDELNRQGYKAIVCYGFDEAKTAIEEYLKLETPS